MTVREAMWDTTKMMGTFFFLLPFIWVLMPLVYIIAIWDDYNTYRRLG